ncbi:hypothetical protein SAMN05444157_2872 [Frankineae bacterium MT45]|nr:hypothetical protein SAMN05444157_2872 [Frankineae bacterium MT45]
MNTASLAIADQEPTSHQHRVQLGRSRSPRTAITVRPAPRREPPFDDEGVTLHLVGSRDQLLPFVEPSRDGHTSTVAADGCQAPPDSELPDPVGFSRRLLVGTMEAFAGHRSMAQLAPYLSRGVFAGLARDCENATVTNRWRGGAAVRSIHLCEPAEGVAEVAAVIAVRGRSRAVALRLEGQHGRWRCVRLQLG